MNYSLSSYYKIKVLRWKTSADTGDSFPKRMLAIIIMFPYGKHRHDNKDAVIKPFFNPFIIKLLLI